MYSAKKSTAGPAGFYSVPWIRTQTGGCNALRTFIVILFLFDFFFSVIVSYRVSSELDDYKRWNQGRHLVTVLLNYGDRELLKRQNGIIRQSVWLW